MAYVVTLQEYADNLAAKYSAGKLTSERFIALTDKLVEWQDVAIERGVMK